MCFHSPLKADMDYRIFTVIFLRALYIYAYIHRGDLSLYVVSSQSTFVESAQNVDSREVSGRVQSLALAVTHPSGNHT